MNPHAGDLAHCKGCHALIVWRINDNGRKQPFNPDGSPHHADCPATAALKRPTPRQADRAANATLQPGLIVESRRLPIMTSRCAGCGAVCFWNAGELVDMEDSAPHRLTCPALNRSARNVYNHGHPCRHCKGQRCQVTTDSRGELHRCVGCRRWSYLNPASVSPAKETR